MLTRCVYDAKAFVEKTRLATDDPQLSTLEVTYRNCLRREAGMVGVVSLKQMQKCKEETGFNE